MAKTPSFMLPLGTQAPPFALLEPSTGRTLSLADFESSPALLVLFTCNHCPYVKHLREGVLQLARDSQARGLAVVGICANDAVSHPDDSPAKMAEEVERYGYPFPYLHDETQAVAKAYRAACTPDFFLFDSRRALVYRGQFDGSRPGNQVPVTGEDLRRAVDAVLAGRAVNAQQHPSLGCSIKWKAGEEPKYSR